MNARAAKLQGGFTVVEAIVTIVIVSITGLALASALGVAFTHSSDALVHSKSTQLAQAYIEEILGQRYAESTPLGGLPPCTPASCGTLGQESETRTQFDDVDDYAGLDDLPPRDSLDQVLAGYDGYRVQVDVAYASAAQVTAWGLDDTSDAKIITVQVTPPGADSRTFQVVRGNY